jgi:RNA polymerase sigma-32 factor
MDLKSSKKSINKKQKPNSKKNPTKNKNIANKKIAAPRKTKNSDTHEVRSVKAELITDAHPDDVVVDHLKPEIEPDIDTAAADLTPTIGSVGSIDSTAADDSTDKSISRVHDPLTLYLTEIRKYPLLSREQESELAKKYYETKDPQLAQTLVKSNLRFVVKIAAEYAKFSSKLIDVIQEGNVGLMHAVKEFNPYKGNRLITYAVWWIRGYIQEYLMRQFSMVRIGTTANQRKLFYQLQKQKQELEKMSSPENVALLSHRLGIPEDEITEMAKRLSSRDVSLDKPSHHDDDSSTPLSSLLKKEDGSLPLDEQMALDEQIALLMSAVEKLKSSLNEKEKIVLDERVLSDEPLTLQEIGDKYGITREAVRQTEVRLMKKIKETMLGPQ